MSNEVSIGTLDGLLRRGLPVGTAIHEAAHALAADEFNLNPIAATVLPSGSFNGAVWYTVTRPWHRVVVMALAGPTAHAMYEQGRVVDMANGSVDYETARKLIAENSADPARELESLQSEAVDFVHNNRRAIKALAIILAEAGELNHQQLRAAIDAAKKEQE